MADRSENQKALNAGLFTFAIVSIAGIIFAICCVAYNADVGVEKPLLPGEERSVRDFGSFNTRDVNDVGSYRVVYTPPSWLEKIPVDVRESHFELQHHLRPGEAWETWKPSEFNPLVGPWAIFRFADGTVEYSAYAENLCPTWRQDTFFVRTRVRDETGQWSTSPTVPIRLHGIQRFKK